MLVMLTTGARWWWLYAELLLGFLDSSSCGIHSVWWHVRLCFHSQTSAKTHPSYSADLPPTSPAPSPVAPSQLPIWSEWIPAAPSPWLRVCPNPYLRAHVTPRSKPIKKKKEGPGVACSIR